MRIRDAVVTAGVLFATVVGVCQDAPQSLGDAARAARQSRKPGSATKVITNEDLASGTPLEFDAAKPDKADSQSEQSAQSDDARVTTDFEDRARAFKREAAQQKARVADAQKRIRELKERLDKWNSEYWAHDSVACGDSPGYVLSQRAALCAAHRYSEEDKEWCNTPQIVEAQTKLAEEELATEQTELARLQDRIRSFGYGTKIYDPD